MSADAAGIDWRLMPAIAVWESSAGRAACGGNAWGLGSCAEGYRFATFEEGVAAVVRTLASPLYAGLTVSQILRRWVAGPGWESEHAWAYAGRVGATMEGLGER